jgi:integrase/recombinase XerD
MSGKKGINNIPGMKHRRKGGYEAAPDGFDRSNPNTLASLIDAWQQRLAERNYSPRTLEAHKWAVRTFLQWTAERDLLQPSEITKPILESFQRHLYRHRKADGQPLGVTTQRARLGAVQRFFAHLCKNNHLAANPAADLDLPRKPHQQLPKGLAREDIAEVLAVPDTRDPLGIRDRAILETLYATGARRTEITNLDLSDLDRSGGTLHIRHGKGDKSRLVPIGKTALNWLQKYLEQTRPRLLLETGEQALFLSGYGTRLSPAYLGNWVARTIKAAGIARQGSCHLFRHSCATHMLENGCDSRIIQQLLGHARADTTAIYTQVAITALREAYTRTHPSAGAGKPASGPPGEA